MEFVVFVVLGFVAIMAWIGKRHAQESLRQARELHDRIQSGERSPTADEAFRDGVREITKPWRMTES
jgi:hypothetical protein